MEGSVPAPGTLLAGRYRVEAVLGRGGMGAVLLASDQSMPREVAIKWLLPRSDPSGEQRFLIEARAMARIEHPNVCGVFDVQFEGALFLVMEHLRGESLAAHIERAALPITEALDIVRDVCRGVAAAHREGVIHRDLKPANVFLAVSKDGSRRTVKVLDFGIAKLSDDELAPARLTKTGVPIGTPRYMSPQHLNGSPATPAFDVYAIGVMLYEVLAGRPPYDAPGLVTLIEQIKSGEHAPLRRHQPLVPPALEALVERAMSLDENARPSIDELLSALELLSESVSHLHPSGAAGDADTGRIARFDTVDAARPPAPPATPSVPVPTRDASRASRPAVAPVPTTQRLATSGGRRRPLAIAFFFAALGIAGIGVAYGAYRVSESIARRGAPAPAATSTPGRSLDARHLQVQLSGDCAGVQMLDPLVVTVILDAGRDGIAIEQRRDGVAVARLTFAGGSVYLGRDTEPRAERFTADASGPHVTLTTGSHRWDSYRALVSAGDRDLGLARIIVFEPRQGLVNVVLDDVVLSENTPAEEPCVVNANLVTRGLR